MSDLFKDHKPELSEEEDRLLWQRVRAIPALETAPAFRPVPWWRRLWAMPAVRFGAPALAVLVAAVVWVVAREPEYRTAARPVREEAPTAARVVAPPSASVPETQLYSPKPKVVYSDDGRTLAEHRAEGPAQKNERLAAIGAKAAPQSAGSGADAAAPADAQDEVVTAQPAAPSTAAMRKAAPAAPAPTATTFATPPPAAESRERKESAESAPRGVDAKAPAKPQWGAVKSQYRDSGNTAQLEMQQQIVSVTDQLISGSLPDPATLSAHPVLRAASSDAYVKAVTFPLPMDVATQADLKLAQAGSYDELAPREQAAAIAYAFERALANPAKTPRARIERMLAHAEAIEDRAGKADKPGASRLVAMIEGALRAWPTN